MTSFVGSRKSSRQATVKPGLRLVETPWQFLPGIPRAAIVDTPIVNRHVSRFIVRKHSDDRPTGFEVPEQLGAGHQLITLTADQTDEN